MLFRSKYQDALSAFKDALALRPNDAAAKQRIDEIQKLVVQTEVKKPDNELSEKQKLYGNYPEGVTNETFNKGGCQILRSVIKNGNSIVVYEKRYYSWGGTFYFRDGSEISGSVYQQGINEQ